MWNIWTKYDIKYNRINTCSNIAASLIASFFLSILCTLNYNIWTYDIRQVETSTGSWHVRLEVPITSTDLNYLENYAGIDHIAVLDEYGRNPLNGNIEPDIGSSADNRIGIFFSNISSTYSDMKIIQDYLLLSSDDITYNSVLLDHYLVYDPEDPNPPLLLRFFLLLMAAGCLSLILILRSFYAMNMNQQIRQLGLLASVGASEEQIRSSLVQKSLILAVLPVLAGTLLGILAAMGLLSLIEVLSTNIENRIPLVFQYHWSVFLITVGSMLLVVGISTWIPARHLSKVSVISALKEEGVNFLSYCLKNNKSRTSLLSCFGAEGQIASAALKSQKRSRRMAFLALSFGYLAFCIGLSFLTLSDISVDHTYFDRYADRWDIMAEIPGENISNLKSLSEISTISGVTDVAAYQKEELSAFFPVTAQSEELMDIGGLSALGKDLLDQNHFRMTVNILVMDDLSFQKYAADNGIEDNLQQGIMINQIWDSIHSPSLNKTFIPVSNESQHSLLLAPKDTSSEMLDEIDSGIDIAYASKMPNLREEISYQNLNVVISSTLWTQIEQDLNSASSHSMLSGSSGSLYIRLLNEENESLQELETIQTELNDLLVQEFGSSGFSTENRIQSKVDNDQIYSIYRLVVSFFCIMLGIIGISGIFFQSLSALLHRKREFAQYISLGMEKKQVYKVLLLEAVSTALKPLLVTIPLFIIISCLMADLSYIEQSLFWSQAPIFAVSIYTTAIVALIVLAYWLGGKKLLSQNIVLSLRDETL